MAPPPGRRRRRCDARSPQLIDDTPSCRRHLDAKAGSSVGHSPFPGHLPSPYIATLNTHSVTRIRPPAQGGAQARRACVVLLFYFFKYILAISFRPIIATSTEPIFRKFVRLVELLAVDERHEVIFFDLSRDVAATTNFVGKIDLQYTPCLVRMTFTRAAPPAHDKKGNCYAGHRQTNYRIRRTQAIRLPNKLTIINRRRGE